MANHCPMRGYWDGWGSSSVQPNSGAFNEDAAFKKSNAAFAGAVGKRARRMQAFTDFILQVTRIPPIRRLQNVLTSDRRGGTSISTRTRPTPSGPSCHVLNPAAGFFGGAACRWWSPRCSDPAPAECYSEDRHVRHAVRVPYRFQRGRQRLQGRSGARLRSTTGSTSAFRFAPLRLAGRKTCLAALEPDALVSFFEKPPALFPPWLKPERSKKRKSVSVLPSCSKPKPRT